MSGVDQGRQRVLRSLQRLASRLESDYPVRGTLWNHDVSPRLRRWRWTAGLRLDFINGAALYVALDFGGSPTRLLDNWVFWGPASQSRCHFLMKEKRRLERSTDPLRPAGFCNPLEKIVREMIGSGQSDPLADYQIYPRLEPEGREIPAGELALRRVLLAKFESEWLLDGLCPRWEVTEREDFWLRTLQPDWKQLTSGPTVQLNGPDYFQHSPLAPKRYSNEWREFYRSYPDHRGVLILSRLGYCSTGLQAMRVWGRDGEGRGLNQLVVWPSPDGAPVWHDLGVRMPKSLSRDFERQSFARELAEVSQGGVTLIRWQLAPKLKRCLGSSGAVLQVGEVRLQLHWLEAQSGLYPEPPVLAMRFSSAQVVWEEIRTCLRC